MNASVFTMDYKDLQVFRLVGSLLVGANAKATSEGVELDVTGLVTENWTLQANYAYLDATYDTFGGRRGRLSGNDLPRAPRTASLYAAPTARPAGRLRNRLPPAMPISAVSFRIVQQPGIQGRQLWRDRRQCHLTSPGTPGWSAWG